MPMSVALCGTAYRSQTVELFRYQRSGSGGVLGAVPSATVMGAHKKADLSVVVALKTRLFLRDALFFLKKLTTFLVVWKKNSSLL